ERHTPVDLLRLEYNNLAQRWEEERQTATENEEYELLGLMKELQEEFEALGRRIASLSTDDLTDERYQLEDRRRAIVRRMDSTMVNRVFQDALKKYEQSKRRTIDLVERDGTEFDQKQLTNLRRQEGEIINSGITGKLEGLTKEMDQLYGRVFVSSPTNLQQYFNQLLMMRGMYNDNRLAETFILAGQSAISQENWPALVNVIQQLNGLLPAHFFSRSGKEGGGLSDIGKIGF
ncbi:MAG: hypothetical protein AAF840_04110, partial [Bacteroidota bacterium]